jgi:hypothetical protein
VIEIPRGLARQFRAVLRRCAAGREPRGAGPLLLCRVGRHDLALQACLGEIAVRHDAAGGRPPDALAFRAAVLAAFEGRSDEPVALEQVSPGKGRARWSDGGVPRLIEFDTVAPESAPVFPAMPRDFAPLPETFLAALAEAGSTTAHEGSRYALSRVQLRGRSGELVATDGRQLLLQGGFQFPWPDDLLVPRLPAFGGREPALQGPVAIGRTQSHVALRVGPWTIALAVDTASRFPRVDDVIPKSSAASSRLALDPEDAAFLAATLPRLPGRDGDHAPVTLDLADPVVVRARPTEGGRATEAVLCRSRATGPAVRLHQDRRYLLRAVQLGFGAVQVSGPDSPVACRDGARTYVWMPLDKSAALPPDPEALRLPSVGDTAPDPAPPAERRTSPMPTPPSNGRAPDSGRPPQPPERAGSLAELIAEAEAVRALLGDALARTARLVASLKQHRKQTRAVEAAVASLRQLQFDR